MSSTLRNHCTIFAAKRQSEFLEQRYLERQMAGGPAGPTAFVFVCLKQQKKFCDILEKLCSYFVENVGAHSVRPQTLAVLQGGICGKVRYTGR